MEATASAAKAGRPNQHLPAVGGAESSINSFTPPFILKTMFLKALHKYIRIYLYTFCRRPGSFTRRSFSEVGFVAKFLLNIQKKYGIILIIGGGPGNGAAVTRTLRNSSSTQI